MNQSFLAQQLWRKLWETYRSRVAYARTYESLIEGAGGAIANDHIAFRSLNVDVDHQGRRINLGISYLHDIFQFLGYKIAEKYEFPDLHLVAYSYRHPDQDTLDLPKLFVSELQVEKLPDEVAQAIQNTIVQNAGTQNTGIQNTGIQNTDIQNTGIQNTGIQNTGIQNTVQLGHFFSLKSFQENLLVNSSKDFFTPSEQDNHSRENAAEMAVADALAEAFVRPWDPPNRKVVEAVNQVSQYGAWVLLHGYSVNHFTGYINRQQIPCYSSLETTAQALTAHGVPMKSRIEGSEASGLKQTATQAVKERVTVVNEEGQLDQVTWNYAYYELAERFLIEDEHGSRSLFQGFISPQAAHLFDMTRNR